MDVGGLQYAMALLGTFGASLAATPLMRRIAMRRQVLDDPNGADGHRKVQTVAVPYLGGVAIAGSAAIALIAGTAAVGTTSADLGLLLGVLLPALVLSAVGLLDDIRGLSPLPRFLVQSLAGAVTAGILTVTGTGTTISAFPPLNMLLTVLWVVGVTNALNLLDNTDGAASGTAAIASFALFAVAALNGQYLVAGLAVALAGSCLGFLVWNHHPASIYMGDSGSLFIGFMLAAISIRLELRNVAQLNALTVPLILLAVPILDTSLVVTSRLRRGMSPFTGGLDHLAHRLRRTGVGVRGAVRRIWAAAAVAGLAAVAISRASDAAGATVAGLAAVAFIAAFLYAFNLPETGDMS